VTASDLPGPPDVSGSLDPGTGGDAAVLLEAQDVSVAFGGVIALREVSLEVRAGEVLGVIGPNGAGKTTLFNVACGFVRPDAGAISWKGRRLDRLQTHQLAGLGIGRTLQGLGLFHRMTVLENVMVGADRHARAGFLSGLLALSRGAKDERSLRDRAMAVLEELGIAAEASRHPEGLPYPVRKRVALARALVGEPELLLLDEPASGLSNTEMDELAELIAHLRRSRSVMLVEHHMDLVMAVCDRLVVLDFGRVIASGRPDEVRDDPGVLAAYLGEASAPGAPAARRG